MTRAFTLVLALIATVGCAASRPRLQLPPYSLTTSTSRDSARAPVRQALDSAHMVVEGSPAPLRAVHALRWIAPQPPLAKEFLPCAS